MDLVETDFAKVKFGPSKDGDTVKLGLGSLVETNGDTVKLELSNSVKTDITTVKLGLREDRWK